MVLNLITTIFIEYQSMLDCFNIAFHACNVPEPANLHYAELHILLTIYYNDQDHGYYYHQKMFRLSGIISPHLSLIYARISVCCSCMHLRNVSSEQQ